MRETVGGQAAVRCEREGANKRGVALKNSDFFLVLLNRKMRTNFTRLRDKKIRKDSKESKDPLMPSVYCLCTLGRFGIVESQNWCVWRSRRYWIMVQFVPLHNNGTHVQMDVIVSQQSHDHPPPHTAPRCHCSSAARVCVLSKSSADEKTFRLTESSKCRSTAYPSAPPACRRRTSSSSHPSPASSNPSLRLAATRAWWTCVPV